METPHIDDRELTRLADLVAAAKRDPRDIASKAELCMSLNLDTADKLLREIDRLKMVDAWQPIASAPKDGSRILVYRPVHDDKYIPKVGMDWWGTFGGRECWAKSRSDTPPTLWRAMPEPPPEQGVSTTLDHDGGRHDRLSL